MKIFETAIISQKPAFLAELTSFLKLDEERILDIDVYRLELAEDFIILLYDLDPEVRLPEEVIEHLRPHLSALLVITDGNFSEMRPSGISMIDELAKALPEVPAIVAVRRETELRAGAAAFVRESGLYLSESGRILYWHPADNASKQRVFRMLWKQLREVPEPA